MLNLFSKIFDSDETRVAKRFGHIIKKINDLEPYIKSLSAASLVAQTEKFRSQIKSGKSLEEILPEAFATVREVSCRILGMRHFDVQLIGGIVLHKGMVAEMKTGEGKTLVATLAAYLNALPGNGVHIVTTNDYLAKRDSEWMGQIYKSLGLTVGCILSKMQDSERKKVYESDIIYATNNELGFDYLRDNMKFSKEEVAQRELNFAIVDEVDSILIDEARTPLIISGPTDNNPHDYTRVDRIISKIKDQDYTLDEKTKSISFTESGQERIEDLLLEAGLLKNKESFYAVENLKAVHSVNQALKAHKIFYKNKDYIVRDGKIVIIDEFTGRMMDGRRYSDGLHQALEAKEKLKIYGENQTLASITFQNYFRMYKKLAGMTGTAKTEEEELRNIYGLRVLQIPTNLTIKRVDEDDEVYASEDEKLLAIVNFIKKCHENGQPVLVGTVSIEKSEQLSTLLKKEKLKHSILNAKHHEQEAKIIAQAGKSKAITIATNMAGRGTDIQLGGSKDLVATANDDEKLAKDIKKDREIVIKSGGLCVIGTERHESRRIDNQLRGRSGRQGDPGRSKFFLSLEDDLLRIFGSDKIKVVLKKLGLKKDEAIHHPWITRALEKAQKKVERRNYEMRKSLIRFDDVINQQRQIVFEHRKQIVFNDHHDITDMAENVNAAMLAESKKKGFYDVDKIKKDFKEVYSLELKGIEKVDDLEGHLKDQSNALLKAKDSIHSNPSAVNEIKKRIIMAVLDQMWKSHLEFLDRLKVDVNLRSVAQKNPLNEFKREAFYAFENMLKEWSKTVIQAFLRVQITKYR